MSQPSPAPGMGEGVAPAIAAAARPSLARRFSPMRLFFRQFQSPILLKEVYVSGRRRATYITRAGYVLLLIIIVTLVYLEARPRHSMQGVAAIQRLQEVAPALTAAVGWFEFVGLALIAPVLAGGAFCDERRSGTLGALFTTPLSAFQIAAGKLAAATVQLLILTLLGAPILLGARVFGGVSASAVMGVTAMALCTALLCAALAMLHSIRAKRGVNATAAAILWMAIISAAPSLILAYLGFRGVVKVSPETMICLSPPATLMALTAQLVEGMGAPVQSELFWLKSVAYLLVLIAITFALMVTTLRRTMIKDAGSPVTFPASRRKGRRRAAATVVDPTVIAPVDSASPSRSDPSATASSRAAALHRKRAALISHDDADIESIGQNPVLWRELRISPFTRRWHLWLALTLIGGILIAVHLLMAREGASGRDHFAVPMVVAVIATFVSVIFAVTSGTGAITNERESRTLESLLTTPLRASEIVLGKFWGALRRQWYVPAGVAVHTLLVSLFTLKPGFLAVTHFLLIWSATAAFLTASGIWLSARAKRTVTASALNFCLALSIWALPFLCCGMFLAIVDSNAHDEVFSVFGAVNPVALTVVAYEGMTRSPVRYEYFDFGRVGVPAFSAAVLGFAVLFALATFGMLALANSTLARLSNRRT